MKFSPQIHLFACFALLANLAVPAVSYGATDTGISSVCTRINSPNGVLLGEKERKQNRDRIMENLKKTLQVKSSFHRQSSGIQTPNTLPAVKAQDTFYGYLSFTITTVCETQFKIHEHFVNYQKQITFLSQSSDKRPEAICGSFQETEKLYQDASAQIQAFNKQQTEAYKQLKISYRQQAAIDKKNIVEDFSDQPPAYAKLKSEFAAVWGASFYNPAEKRQTRDESFPVEKSSVFGQVIYRLDENQRDSAEVAKKMETARASSLASHKSCETYVGADRPKVEKAALDDSDISGADDGKKDDGGKIDTGYGDGDSPSEIARAEREKARLAALNNADDKGNGDDTGGDQNNGNGSGDGTGDGDGKNGPVEEPPPITPPPATAEKSWISENKGLLLTVGGGAAAIGGILWYKNHQDKKEKEENAALSESWNAANASASNTASDTSTSTTTNTDSTVGGTSPAGATPPGSKFVVSGIPAGAQVNNNLTDITVKVIDPQGILTQDSDTNINVGCETPVPCSITGTLTVNTDAGKAVFRDLRFTSAQSGVKLKFSAPGFAPVVSGNSFEVTP